ncbi:MAG: beta-phosphoglucomutase family hydrolase [Balneolales bacterium]
MNKTLKAGIFDMDGVITDTARLHAKAWKTLFDEYKSFLDHNKLETFKPFSIEGDYPIYIDGVPRYQGVESFLISRNIKLPFGDPSDEPNMETICGLGNRKNEIFYKVLDETGVDILIENVDVIIELKDRGLKTAIISSSKNCKEVLERAGLLYLFPVRVDGVISKERGLKGKPEPDIFLEAARELGVKPEETMIVEDALAGIEAGKKGGFQLVIGIGGDEQREAMLKLGADQVVPSLMDADLIVVS